MTYQPNSQRRTFRSRPARAKYLRQNRPKSTYDPPARSTAPTPSVPPGSQPQFARGPEVTTGGHARAQLNTPAAGFGGTARASGANPATSATYAPQRHVTGGQRDPVGATTQRPSGAPVQRGAWQSPGATTRDASMEAQARAGRWADEGVWRTTGYRPTDALHPYAGPVEEEPFPLQVSYDLARSVRAAQAAQTSGQYDDEYGWTSTGEEAAGNTGATDHTGATSGESAGGGGAGQAAGASDEGPPPDGYASWGEYEKYGDADAAAERLGVDPAIMRWMADRGAQMTLERGGVEFHVDGVRDYYEAGDIGDWDYFGDAYNNAPGADQRFADALGVPVEAITWLQGQGYRMSRSGDGVEFINSTGLRERYGADDIGGWKVMENAIAASREQEFEEKSNEVIEGLREDLDQGIPRAEIDEQIEADRLRRAFDQSRVMRAAAEGAARGGASAEQQSGMVAEVGHQGSIAQRNSQAQIEVRAALEFYTQQRQTAIQIAMLTNNANEKLMAMRAVREYNTRLNDLMGQDDGWGLFGDLMEAGGGAAGGVFGGMYGGVDGAIRGMQTGSQAGRTSGSIGTAAGKEIFR